MFYPHAKTGVIVDTGPNRGGHAYLLAGYNRRQGLFRILNSWSERWGQNGRAWIEGETLERLLNRAGEAVTAIEKAAA